MAGNEEGNEIAIRGSLLKASQVDDRICGIPKMTNLLGTNKKVMILIIGIITGQNNVSSKP